MYVSGRRSLEGDVYVKRPYIKPPRSMSGAVVVMLEPSFMAEPSRAERSGAICDRAHNERPPGR